ncbi:MAG: glycosyltransferase family 2 protein [Dehalococcoidia bacterium]
MKSEFGGSFRELLITIHPANLPGEVRGKSSNENWAARRAYEDLVQRRGMNPGHMTITSCDADARFHRSYFSCLASKFATDPNRYRRFWQAPIFYYNNIWRVPAPLRILNGLGGLIHLSKLTRRRVVFPQSTYSLSLRMANEVGYWDPDVVSEDWHMFLKWFYVLKGEVQVEPIYLPVGNDAALADSYAGTLVNHYLQVKRWAWGAEDIVYAWRAANRQLDIPFRRRFLRFWYVFENHVMWSNQWFVLNMGGTTALLVSTFFGARILPEWFQIGSRLILTPCLIPEARPATTGAPLRSAQIQRTPLAARPSRHELLLLGAASLDAQLRLALGQALVYRVTEKAVPPTDGGAEFLAAPN